MDIYLNICKDVKAVKGHEFIEAEKGKKSQCKYGIANAVDCNILKKEYIQAPHES
jgi:hypothetical protein